MIDPVLVGSVIRGLREKKGKTQEVVSGLAGLDRTHYSKIERGLRSPTLDTLFCIAQAQDMKPHELLLEIEKALEAYASGAFLVRVFSSSSSSGASQLCHTFCTSSLSSKRSSIFCIFVMVSSSVMVV